MSHSPGYCICSLWHCLPPSLGYPLHGDWSQQWLRSTIHGSLACAMTQNGQFQSCNLHICSAACTRLQI